MRSRNNPWPAFVDLFSALLITTLGGFILLSGVYDQDVKIYQQKEEQLKQIRQEAKQSIDQVQTSLGSKTVVKEVRATETERFFDLDIRFGTSDDTLDQEGSRRIAEICHEIRSIFNNLSSDQKRDIEIIIEGHTDSQQAKIVDQREKDRFNWNLSARRATSVLYEFAQNGIRSPEYQIVATGFADSRPLCLDLTPECYSRNRRTTLCLRVNTKNIEDRLEPLLKGEGNPNQVSLPEKK